MTAIQQPLDGMPVPPPADADYETWVEKVRPVFVEAAQSGRKFASWQIKVAKKLPDPPKPKTQWGSFIHLLHKDGVLKRAGWTETRDGSSVRRWEGTRAARSGRAA